MCGWVSSPTCSFSTLDHDVLVHVGEPLGLGQRRVRQRAEERVADEDQENGDDGDAEQRAPEPATCAPTSSPTRTRMGWRPRAPRISRGWSQLTMTLWTTTRMTADRDARCRRLNRTATTIGGRSASGGPKNGMSIARRADAFPTGRGTGCRTARADQADQQRLHARPGSAGRGGSRRRRARRCLEQVRLVAVAARDRRT